MDSGVIFTVEEGDSELSSFREEEALADELDNTSLTQAVEITREQELPDGTRFQLGEAASQEFVEVNDVEITDENISERTVEDIETRYTRFVYLPGQFLIVGSNSGKFLSRLVNQHTELALASAKIQLNAFLEDCLSDHSDADPWKVGIEDMHGLADNGVIHGSSLLEDDSFGDLLGVSDKNQIGIDYDYDRQRVKVFLAKSGYIEVYQPQNFTTEDFVKYVRDEILYYTTAE
jgi:hypothetical protein